MGIVKPFFKSSSMSGKLTEDEEINTDFSQIKIGELLSSLSDTTPLMPTVLMNQLMQINGMSSEDKNTTKLLTLMSEYLLSEVVDEASFIAQKRSSKAQTVLKLEDLQLALQQMKIPFSLSTHNSF